MNDRFSADDLPRKAGSAPRKSPWPIDLAHSRPFRIGDAEVRPASREIVRGEQREVLEPLVMQVLVALHSSRGEVLNRDDLIDACWGGRAVTDDALNRVLSRLRALARAFGSFRIETITKVGYRLIVDGEDLPPTPLTGAAERTSRISRRAAIAGATAVAGLSAGVVLWRQPWRHRISAEATNLFQLGQVAQRQGIPSQIRQAISYYEQAVRVDPLYADAWGALALAQTHVLEGFGEPGTEGVPARLVSAARRALQLDPDNTDAQLALILLKPFFRNWSRTESELRRLSARYPDHWLARGRLGVLLYDVGRLNEGIEIHSKLYETDALLPVRYSFWANALLNSGRLDEASGLLDRAHQYWPAHPTLWKMKYRFLLFSGRPRAAAAFAMDPESRPSGLDRNEVELRLSLARAVASRTPADVDASVEDFRRMAMADVSTTPFAATTFALLGRTDLTFASLDRYYFNRGSFGSPSPIGPYTRRYTTDLFSPPLTPLKSDPRFMSILQRIGLEDYWRETRTAPDYRQA